MIEVPYKDVDFVWVSSHYDFHREGICRHNGELARFTCIEDYPPDWGTCGEECDGCSRCEDYPIVCNIWPLTRLQKLRWIWSKKLFEFCIGHHWTYPNRPNGASFRSRRPRWFYAALFAIYYRNWRNAWTVFYRWRRASR